MFKVNNKNKHISQLFPEFCLSKYLYKGGVLNQNLFIKNSQNSQEKTCVRDFLGENAGFTPVALFKKASNRDVFLRILQNF